MVALSLTEKPLAETDALLVKMVSVAANTGERKTPREAPSSAPQFRLEAFGDAPVVTHGQRSGEPATIAIGGELVISAYLQNGTWEVAKKGKTCYVWCDTPGAGFSLSELGPEVAVTPFTASGPGESKRMKQPIAYPPKCLFVRVTPTP